jgi:putative ABC transport system permease protein
MTNLLELSTEAIKALLAHRLRSALTMLGIVIGVTSVILMLAIGEGSRRRVAEQISALGAHQIVVLAGGGNQGGLRGSVGGLPTLTTADAEAVALLSSVKAVAPVSQSSARAVQGAHNRNLQIVGSWPSYLGIQRWILKDGRSFSEAELRAAASVGLIGKTARQELFPEVPAAQSVVGRSLRVQRQVIEIIGELEPKGSGLNGQDQDDFLLLPLTTAQRRLAGTPFPGSVGSFVVEAIDPARKAHAQQEIRSLLRQRHRLAEGTEDDFNLLDLAALSATLNTVSQVLSVLLGAIAFISLLVGGIGVMNIMLVSVAERTKEIGLRIALGATRLQVSQQFLLEALALTLCGAFGGLLLALAVAALINLSGALTVPFTSGAVLLAVGVAGSVGLLFGWLPARRAAQLVPADALRSA